MSKSKPLRVLFSHAMPFYLAHGGCQTMIESIAEALRELGVDVGMEAWWASREEADILHYFGRPPVLNVRLARGKGYPVVFTDVLDSTASRSALRLAGQKLLIKTLRKGLGSFAERFAWESYGLVDAYVTIVPHEGDVARRLFGVPGERCHVIPHGLPGPVLQALAEPGDGGSDSYLFSMATIHPRKNSLPLARLAREQNIPMVFAGKPYAEDDYFRAFMSEVDGKVVRYAGYVSEEEKLRWMKNARGFVLLSEYESGCVAVYEAAAAGLPLLLSDKPWARKAYSPSNRIAYANVHKTNAAATTLRSFFAGARRQPGTHTFPVGGWLSVAAAYKKLYETILKERGFQ